ncbi:TetR/AcrR family transcriptional regulator [Thiolapillus sp.]
MPYLNKTVSLPEPVDCRILTAALDLFVEHGFHNVSVHDVQKQANVSIGSIYNHFGGKEGIAKALYKHLLNEFQEMIDSVISETRSSRECCNRIIARLFEYTETRRNIMAFLLHTKHREFLSGEPPLCHSSPFAAMRKIVADGMAANEIRSGDPWVMTASIFGGAIRLIHLRLDGVIDQPLPGYYQQVIDNIWKGVA